MKTKQLLIYMILLFFAMACNVTDSNNEETETKTENEEEEIALLKRFLVVPDSFPTIKEAIEGSASGDTILVRPGNHHHDHVVINNQVTIISEYVLTGEEAKIWDTKLIPETVSMSVITSDTVVINGLSFVDGRGGIEALSNSVKIYNCIFQNLESAIYYMYRTVYLENVLFIDNKLVFFEEGRTIGKRVAFIRNDELGGELHLSNALIVHNKDLTKYILDMSITNSTIFNNNGNFPIGSHGHFGRSHITFSNSIIYNPQNEYEFIYHNYEDEPSTLNISYSILKNGKESVLSKQSDGTSLNFNYGPGMITEEPQFRDPENYDFRLIDNSVGIHAGDSASEFNNPDGTRNTIGFEGGPDAEWPVFFNNWKPFEPAN